MKISGERVLVTGAGGFIGSHLVELLVQRSAHVRALVHYNSRNDWGHLERLAPETREALDVRLSDVTDGYAVSEAAGGCRVVFHLAALIGIPYSYVAPASYLDTNVRGTLNVLEAARRHGVERLVHTSTSEVYGTARYTPIDEDHPLQAQSPYAASKIAADKLAESYHRAFGIPVTTLRPFNAYGPRQSARAIVPTIVAQAALDEGPLRLGNLDPVRDFTFVTDTARAFVAAAECDGAVGMVLNAGSGTAIAIADLAKTILRLMKRPRAIETETARVRPGDSEVFELVSANARIEGLTGWRPEVGLETGLERTIADVLDRLDTFRAGQYTI